jgi:flagella basal body P-ring formation protein FlgA
MLILLLLLFAHPASCTRILMKKEAVVIADYIRLADIARIKDCKEGEKQLASLKIAPSPPLGKWKKIKASFLHHKLKRMGIRARIEGEWTKVKRPIHTLRKEKFLKIALMHLRKELPIHAECKLIRCEGQFAAPVKEPQIYMEGIRSLGRHKKVILCMSAEGWSKRVALLFRLQQREAVVVAARPIPKGKRIEEEDLCIEYRNVKLHSFFPRLEQVLGRRARVFIRRGKIITERELLKEFAIKRGDIVKVRFQRGAVFVQTKGVVYNDAQLGQRVLVRNIDSKKVVEGVLLDKETVVVR